MKPTLAPVLDWFRGRTQRERILLATFGVLSAGLLGWYGLVEPVDRARDQSDRRLAAALADLNAVEAIAARIKSSRDAKGPAPADLEPTVRSSAADEGITITLLEQEGAGRIALSATSPSSTAALNWLSSLDADRGVRVETAVLSSAAPDEIQIDATLSGERQ